MKWCILESRKEEFLKLYNEGLTDKQIAKGLGTVSAATVGKYRRMLRLNNNSCLNVNTPIARVYGDILATEDMIAVQKKYRLSSESVVNLRNECARNFTDREKAKLKELSNGGTPEEWIVWKQKKSKKLGEIQKRLLAPPQTIEEESIEEKARTKKWLKETWTDFAIKQFYARHPCNDQITILSDLTLKDKDEIRKIVGLPPKKKKNATSNKRKARQQGSTIEEMVENGFTDKEIADKFDLTYREVVNYRTRNGLKQKFPTEEERKEAILGVYEKGMTFKEIAEETGYSTTTVWKFMTKWREEGIIV